VSTPRPARYPRSFGALIGSTVVLVGAVVGLWVLQNLSHNSLSSSQVVPAVDWKPIVAQIQTVRPVAYPGSIPTGWKVTSANYDISTDPGRPLWMLGMTTTNDGFAGLYEQNDPASDLAAQSVGTAAVSGGTTTVDSPVGGDWTAWHDSDGDVGYSTEIGRDTVIVYGTSDTDVRQLAGLLTEKKLPTSLIQ
jgi:hypothetical protein